MRVAVAADGAPVRATVAADGTPVRAAVAADCAPAWAAMTAAGVLVGGAAKYWWGSC